MSEEVKQIVHLMVDHGPDKGRAITVPEAGARIGRSSQNDIELTDPSISRFQCRVFFKPDGLLWIADLGSTNETLVNSKPVLENKLNVGDTIEVGETVVRVVCDNLKGVMSGPPPLPAASPVTMPHHEPGYAPPPAFAPFEKIDDAAAEGGKIDLGLERKPGARTDGEAKTGAGRWLWLVLVLMIALAAVAVVKSGVLNKTGAVAASGSSTGAVFSIYFEKVNASVSNIFRYALSLEDGVLAVRIDSVTENRHVQREKKLGGEILEKLKGDILGGGFFKLEESYPGLQPNTYNSADLEVTIGAQNKRSVVLNRPEPDEFKKVREAIEQFAKNELGLITMSLSPEKLVSLAYEANQLGQKLYGEREVRFVNLWESIRAYEEAQIYLETIEPKPDFHTAVVEGLATSRAALDEQVESYRFQADKAIRLKDWKTAAENLRVIKELVPDRGDPRNDDAEKKLIHAERSIKK